MNIFALDSNPRLAAIYHCDKHVVKMILEYAQLLSTAHHVLDGDEAPAGIYKATHINHPCAVWTRSSYANYSWLVKLFQECLKEYTFRYGKHHSAERLIPILKVKPRNITIGGQTLPPLCMPDYCKVYDNPEHWQEVTRSYRKYYMKEKKDILKWKNRQKPWWFNDYPSLKKSEMLVTIWRYGYDEDPPNRSFLVTGYRPPSLRTENVPLNVEISDNISIKLTRLFSKSN